MKAIGIIPARYASRRFPGKPLSLIKNKPLLQHVYEKVLAAGELENVIIATDDTRIRDLAESFSAPVIMTSSECNSGTDRIIEAIKNIEGDIFVNVQGDEPLISPKLIDAVTRAAKEEKIAACVTCARKSSDPEEWGNTSVVKVVLDKDNFALYFSRSVIPYPREKSPVYYKHIGIYTYTRPLLEKIKITPPAEIEMAESLEQLRILFLGEKIKVVITDYDSISVDLPEDILKVERIL